MDDPTAVPRRPILGSQNAALAEVQSQAFKSLTTPVGRRNVKIYAVPPESMTAVVMTIIVVGLPSMVFISLVPAWEAIGRLPWVATLTAWTAPAVSSIDFGFRSDALPEFPLKRFFVASMSMVEILVLANFIPLLSQRVRKRALMVWLCFDRKRLLRTTLITGGVLVALWWFFFSDWTMFHFFGDSGTRGGAKLILYCVFALPNVALVFGHLASIVAAGLARDLEEKLRQVPFGRRR